MKKKKLETERKGRKIERNARKKNGNSGTARALGASRTIRLYQDVLKITDRPHADRRARQRGPILQDLEHKDTVRQRGGEKNFAQKYTTGRRSQNVQTQWKM